MINTRSITDLFNQSKYFSIAILFHLILFLLFATWIVFKAPTIREDTTSFHTLTIPVPRPNPPPPSGGEVANQLAPSPEMAAPPSVPSVVATAIPSSFSMNAVKINLPNLPPSLDSAPIGAAMTGKNTPGVDLGAGSPFGSSQSSGAPQFEGYLYDLKQTRSGDSTNMDPGTYEQKILQFLNSDWDESVLRDFYKSPKPLSTSAIFIPIIKAEDGPKAFGVEGRVKPNMYCVLYKLKASPPQNGTYRFVGIGDDILFVRVNHKTVLDGSDFGIYKEIRSKQTYMTMTNFTPTFDENSKFWIGLPFSVSKGESVDIEVLIGEQPGGRSDYFLFIQRDESVYQKQSNGSPLLPIFQVGDPIKPRGEPMSYPPFAENTEAWTAEKNGL